MLDIADVPFSAVPADEQMRFVSKTKEVGDYRGYKPRQYWVRYSPPPQWSPSRRTSSILIGLR